MTDTIFALSSGAPPAAIGVIRVSGPLANDALTSLTRKAIEPRRPLLARLQDLQDQTIDNALVIYFPGPNSATGEDLAELHCHGGRAVVAAVEAALGAMDGLRKADPGEFTRRAFANGRIDLAEAEGLADLLGAETELQRRSALAVAGGAISRQVELWRQHLLGLSAQVEGVLDFSDEEDSACLPESFGRELEALRTELRAWLARPRSERLGEGFRVTLSGPPNSGKSSLFNALVESEAAITSPISGTTRDLIERSVAIEGVPFTFVDTAGLHEGGADPIEAIGIERARSATSAADLVLWLGKEGDGPEHGWEIESQVDRPDRDPKRGARHRVSALTLEGVADLKRDLVERARDVFPKPGEAALNARQHDLLTRASEELELASGQGDPLLVGENLRVARVALDQLVGRTTTEDMLDTLFGRFCIGK